MIALARDFLLMSTALCATAAGLAVAQSPQSSARAPATRPSAAPTLAHAEADAFRAAAAAVRPCVVTIETVGGTQPLVERPGRPAAHPAGFVVADGPTTGLIYSADGLILTSSFNFVRHPSVITVVLADGRRFVAELLARDEVRRLAMLKIDAKDLPTPTWLTPTAEIRVGASAIALGRGHGATADIHGNDAPATASSFAGCSLTVGIISGKNRMSGLALQTDARLSPANFGGPLIDLDGLILGLCVPLGLGTTEIAGVEWYDSGIGFAIPHEQIITSVQQLAAGHNLRPGLLGIAILPAIRDAIVIAETGNPSPARRSGLQAGDRITALAGEPVANYADVKRILRSRYAGEWIDVRILRDGHPRDIPVMLGVPEDIGPLPKPDTPPSTGNE